MSPFIAEYIGTTLLILLGGGVVANVVLNGTKGNGGGLIAITTAWALAVFVGVLVAGPYSGAHLSPAVTIGLAVGGKFAWDLVAGYLLAQMLGAMTGAVLVWLVYKDHFDITEDAEAKKAVFCTSPSIRNLPINFISELIGTFVLILAVFYITGAEMTDSKQPIGLGTIGAIPVAFVVWGIGLSLGGTTGYAINPVRDLGPRIIHAILPIKNKANSDWSYAWVPIIGPIVGAIIAALLYLTLQA